MVREVLSMPALKRLVLKGPAITTEMLQVIFDVRELEHLEVIYAPIDDSSIETLVDLPLVGSLRLFGTKITRDGATRLKKDLDGLDVYVGRGGFLGVQTSQSDLRVSRVVSGSGAELGGIIEYDVITHINGKPIKIDQKYVMKPKPRTTLDRIFEMRMVWSILLMMAMVSVVKAEIQTKIVEYKDGDVSLEGFVAYDPAKAIKPGPAVLVINSMAILRPS